jgi:CHAD domain-containing protein
MDSMHGSTKQDLAMERWVYGRSPDDRITDVALRTLQGRLGTVLHHLRLAAEKAGEDIEHVHQLRVWTRRATAALRLYEDLLPPRRLHWVKRQLKHVRRAANDARDCDVLLHRLKNRQTDPGNKRWFESVHSERTEAQRAIVAAYHRFSRGRRFERHVDKLLRRLRFRAEDGSAAVPRFFDWAHLHVRLAVKQFFAALPPDHTDEVALHQFRIMGKELRYTMELLAGAFPESFRTQLYPTIEEIQDRLGEVNDLATAVARLRKKIKKATRTNKDVICWQRLLLKEQAQLDQTRQKFWEWCSARRSQDLRERFKAVLAGSGWKQRTCSSRELAFARQGCHAQPEPRPQPEPLRPKPEPVHSEPEPCAVNPNPCSSNRTSRSRTNGG